MRRSTVAFLSLSVSLGIGASLAHSQVFDHLQCFKIKDSAPKAEYAALLTASDPTFAVPPGCTIKVPAKLLCVDTRKTNVTPAPPGSTSGDQAQKYLCYKAKCEKIEPTITLQDQFGSHDILLKRTSLLCAPVAPPCTPSAEQCNGLDDDCDGTIDDGTSGAACDGADTDLCADGTVICTGGALICNDDAASAVEVCDDIDNDCNGVVDDGTGGEACDGADTDACAEGTTICASGVLTCSDATGNSVEVCGNGLDDDCDGFVDNGCP